MLFHTIFASEYLWVSNNAYNTRSDSHKYEICCGILRSKQPLLKFMRNNNAYIVRALFDKCNVSMGPYGSSCQRFQSRRRNIFGKSEEKNFEQIVIIFRKWQNWRRQKVRSEEAKTDLIALVWAHECQTSKWRCSAQIVFWVSRIKLPEHPAPWSNHTYLTLLIFSWPKLIARRNRICTM